MYKIDIDRDGSRVPCAASHRSFNAFEDPFIKARSEPPNSVTRSRWLTRWLPHGALFALAVVGPAVLTAHPYFELRDWVFWQALCLVFASLGAATKVFVDRYPRAAKASYACGVIAQILFILASVADTSAQAAQVWDEYTMVGLSVAFGAVSFAISAAALNQRGEAKNLRRW